MNRQAILLQRIRQRKNCSQTSEEKRRHDIQNDGQPNDTKPNWVNLFCIIIMLLDN